MKIYLAGPMTGLPDYNFPAFMAAAARLRAEYPNAEVFNPAQADLDRWGDMDAVRKNATYRECLKVDLAWICDNATHIALLPGFENSAGVRAELSLAHALKLEVIHLAE